MEELEKNGLVETIKTSSSTFYKITEKGIESYHKWIKSFLDFSRSVNKIEDPE
jgi:DNA-binding PadR family transcriptional regulator